jgi:hypothetical protein
LARQGSSSLIFDFQLPNSYPNTIPFIVKKCFKNNRKITLIRAVIFVINSKEIRRIYQFFYLTLNVETETQKLF